MPTDDSRAGRRITDPAFEMLTKTVVHAASSAEEAKRTGATTAADVRGLRGELEHFKGESLDWRDEVRGYFSSVARQHNETLDHLRTLNGRVGRGEDHQATVDEQLRDLGSRLLSLASEIAFIRALNTAIRFTWAVSSKTIVRVGVTMLFGAIVGAGGGTVVAVVRAFIDAMGGL